MDDTTPMNTRETAIGLLTEVMLRLRNDGNLRDADFANQIERSITLLKHETAVEQQEVADENAPLPTGYQVTRFLPNMWEWNRLDETGSLSSEGTYYGSYPGAVVGAWQHYSEYLISVIQGSAQ